MKIALGTDHAGLKLKNIIKEFLSGDKNYEIKDFGTFSETPVDYPDFAHKVAKQVADKTCDIGILICGTGSGMCITANKTKGIRAVNCLTTQMAELAIQHNNANILCLGARLISQSLAKDIVETFLLSHFEGDRHQTRIDKIETLE